MISEMMLKWFYIMFPSFATQSKIIFLGTMVTVMDFLSVGVRAKAVPALEVLKSFVSLIHMK